MGDDMNDSERIVNTRLCCCVCKKEYITKFTEAEKADYLREVGRFADMCQACWEKHEEKQWARAGLAACL